VCHGGSDYNYRLEYSGGCKITVKFVDDHSKLPSHYIKLEYVPLKYTTALCLYFMTVTDDFPCLIDCIDLNTKLEEIKKWFVDTMQIVFNNEPVKVNVKELVDTKEIDLEKYIEELTRCYQEVSPIIQREQENEDKEVRKCREIEEMLNELRKND
jgi:hypothetical protein